MKICENLEKYIKLEAKSCPPGANKSLFYKKSIFLIALNRVLTPAVDRSRRELSESSGIIDFENKNISVVTKH